jgi:hypothetical protein
MLIAWLIASGLLSMLAIYCAAIAASAPTPCLIILIDDDPTHGIGIIQVLPVHSRHLSERVESTSTVPVSHSTFQLSQRVSGIRQSGVQVGRYASSLSGGGSTSVG